MVSQEDLVQLASLSGYDRMLAMDAVARKNGVSPADVERALNAHVGGAAPATGVEQPPFSAVPDVPAQTSAVESLDFPIPVRMHPSADAKSRSAGQLSHSLSNVWSGFGHPERAPDQGDVPRVPIGSHLLRLSGH